MAYEGTCYAGWQRQKNARTIQGTLEQAFHKILGEKVHVVAAGRTDSGVHAEGQVAHAQIRSRIVLSSLLKALNAVLPEDVLIRSVRRASTGFHARYSAKEKLYRYTIHNDPLRPLFDRERVLHVSARLDVSKMRQAARLLKGRHDFRAFHSSGRPVAQTIRNLRRLAITKKNHRIRIDAQADGFLYHMVRRMTGLMLEIGKGKYPPEIVGEMLKGKSRVAAPTAPAQGLSLIQVRYEDQS